MVLRLFVTKKFLFCIHSGIETILHNTSVCINKTSQYSWRNLKALGKHGLTRTQHRRPGCRWHLWGQLCQSLEHTVAAATGIASLIVNIQKYPAGGGAGQMCSAGPTGRKLGESWTALMKTLFSICQLKHRDIKGCTCMKVVRSVLLDPR